VHTSASAIFYAPSELAGPGGMHREVMRSTSLWYRAYERRDTILFADASALDPEAALDGMAVGRVMRFLSFDHDDAHYTCALVELFERTSDAVDPLTGMWIVRPRRQRRGGRRELALVHTDHIFRSCHLIGRYGTARIPHTFHFSLSHVAFRTFYLNRYADYHAHECIPVQ
jgi:hypothetical protein